MKILRFTLFPQSLVSMRLPFTWQAATSYPLPPPSTVLGLLANALWEAGKRSHPMKALGEIEGASPRVWVGAPGKMTATYTTVTTWFGEGGLKSNILPRQFLFAPGGFEVFVLFEGEELAWEAAEALRRAPVYLGDSEGLASVREFELLEAEETKGPVPEAELGAYFNLNLLAEESPTPKGTLFWVNERCNIRGSDQMVPYLFPVVQEGKAWKPAERGGATVKFKEDARLLRVKGLVLPFN